MLILLFAFGSVNADQQLYSGDVVLVPLESTEINLDFYFKNNPVTTVRENNKFYLLFGIPYDSSVGVNNFVFYNKSYKKNLIYKII